jgi:hypothetical protein
MTKTIKFTNDTFTTDKFFFTTPSKPNYFEILDDIITTDIAKKNSYLFNTTPSKTTLSDTIILSSPLKANNTLIKAANYLANYKKIKTLSGLPIILGKMYELADGTRIIFDEDEIQIGFDIYKYSDFANLSFLNALKPSTKKTIINIYTSGMDDIKINIL